jgi:hypothetical protein
VVLGGAALVVVLGLLVAAANVYVLLEGDDSTFVDRRGSEDGSGDRAGGAKQRLM